MTIFLISVSIALGVSFLCSLAEAALLSLTPIQIARISEKHPSTGRIWQRFKFDISRPISVILILNTSAHTIGAAVAGSEFDDIFGDSWLWAFSLLLTFLMLQFTEILPKSLGVRFNKELSYVIAKPLDVGIKLFDPIIRIIHFINKPFEKRSPKKESFVTIEEITALAGLSRLSKHISLHQEKIIKGASRLASLKVKDVMIPVEQVTFLSSSQTIAQAVISAHNDFHTRYPVCEEENRDRVLGYVNFKEMIYFMKTNTNDQSFKGIIRPLHFSVSNDSAADMLNVFIDQHIHISIVRDHSGKTLGLVTLEDIVEELVGELEDEFDRLPKMIHPLSSGTWMMGGGVPMSDIAKQLGNSAFQTEGRLADWLVAKIGRVPQPGDSFMYGGIEFSVRRVRRGRVFEAVIMIRGTEIPNPLPSKLKQDSL